ncbi:IS66 family transposase [Rhodovulum sp. YEN HP10]|uniref:IS66 family transposase n=1 Tax=Rhodovulum sp. HP10 TaxID=3387397 RepID=UPI0039E1EA85
MSLNRQAVVMARHGVSSTARCWPTGWAGPGRIAAMVDHMARRLMTDSSRPYVDETIAPRLDPGKGKTKTGYLRAARREQGANGHRSDAGSLRQRIGASGFRSGPCGNEIRVCFLLAGRRLPVAR